MKKEHFYNASNTTKVYNTWAKASQNTINTLEKVVSNVQEGKGHYCEHL